MVPVYRDSCKHPPTAIREHLEGHVCTACGMVVDALVFDEQPIYVEYAPLRVPKKESAKKCSSATAIVRREEKRTYIDTKVVEDFATTLHLGAIILATAKEIFTDAVKAKLATGGFRGVALEAAAASAIYYACKVESFDRTEGEIASNCKVRLSTLAATNKVMRRLLSKKPYGAKILAPIKPKALIPRFIAAMCVEPSIIMPPEKVRAVRMRLENLMNAADTARTFEGKTPECVCVSLMILAIVHVLPTSDRKDIITRCADRAGLSTGAILSAVKAFEQQRVAVR